MAGPAMATRATRMEARPPFVGGAITADYWGAMRIPRYLLYVDWSACIVQLLSLASSGGLWRTR